MRHYHYGPRNERPADVGKAVSALVTAVSAGACSADGKGRSVVISLLNCTTMVFAGLENTAQDVAMTLKAKGITGVRHTGRPARPLNFLREFVPGPLALSDYSATERNHIEEQGDQT
jgi:hypothetical protein